MLGHSQRVDGFRETVSSRFPDMNIVEVIENQDDEISSYKMVREQLEKHPMISAVFFAAAGTAGGMRAVRELRDKDITIISVDCTDEIRRDLHEGWIDATISQQPVLQGHKAVELFYRMLCHGEMPKASAIYVRNEILIRESLGGEQGI